MSVVIKSSAEDSKPSVEQSNITAEQLASRRIAQLSQKASPAPKEEPKVEPKEQVETEAEPAAEEAKDDAPFKEGGEKSEEAKDEGKEVPSNINVDELSDDEITELAKKGKSGLLKRIAELTAKRKLAEERVAQMEAAFRANQSTPKLEQKVENNPFAQIDKADELQSKWSEVGEVIKWAEAILDDAEHAGADDPVAQVDGKALTKKQVKQYLRNAREARDTFLPAQFKEIQAKEVRKVTKAQYEQKARQELPWLSTEDNDTKRQYDALVKSPLVERVKKAVPEVEADLDYIIGHAVNSLYGRREIALDSVGTKSTANRISPPANPGSTAAAPSGSDAREAKAMKEAKGRLKDSGSIDDYVALRAAQISKRKLIK